MIIVNDFTDTLGIEIDSEELAPDANCNMPTEKRQFYNDTNTKHVHV